MATAPLHLLGKQHGHVSYDACSTAALMNRVVGGVLVLACWGTWVRGCAHLRSEHSQRDGILYVL